MDDKVIQRFETQGEQLIVNARAVQIIDEATREDAANFSANTRKAIKAIKEEFRPDIDTANRLHKDLLSRMKRLTKPFEDAKGIVDSKIQQDFLERERKRKAEEREAWLRDEAERKRQEESRLADVEDAIERGDMEEAETILDSEVVVAAPVPVAKVEQTTRSSAGSITMRKDIRVELVDKNVVITAVGDGKLPSSLLTVDMGAAKRYAKAAGLTTMPGFTITETAIVSGRTR